MKKNLSLRVEAASLALMSISEVGYIFGPHFNEIHCRFQQIDEGRYDEYRENCPHPILSMDPLYEGDYNLGISRLYDEAGQEFIGHFSRPETKTSLIKQFRKIPKNSKVVIFEDDIGYGGQIRQVKKILDRMNVQVVEVFTLYDNSGLEDEVLDLRDFLVGETFGGLVVRTPMFPYKIRVPYLFPFIDVQKRCSIEDHVGFSKAMWEFNKKIAQSEERATTFCDRMMELCDVELREAAGKE